MIKVYSVCKGIERHTIFMCVYRVGGLVSKPYCLKINVSVSQGQSTFGNNVKSGAFSHQQQVLHFPHCFLNYMFMHLKFLICQFFKGKISRYYDDVISRVERNTVVSAAY